MKKLRCPFGTKFEIIFHIRDMENTTILSYFHFFILSLRQPDKSRFPALFSLKRRRQTARTWFYFFRKDLQSVHWSSVGLYS